MNEHDAVQAVGSSPKDPGLSWRGLWEVFSSPTQLFQKLKAEPKILVPYIVLGVTLLAFFFLTVDLIVKMQMELMQERLQGQSMTPGMEAGIRISTLVFGTLGFLLEPIIIAGLALFWGNFVFAGKAQYRQVLTVALYCSVLYAFGMMLTLPMILAKGSMMASYSLGVLAADSGPTSFMFQLLSRIGLFHIWEWVVLGIGMSVVFATSVGRGVTIALLSSGLLSVIAILSSAVGSMFS